MPVKFVLPDSFSTDGLIRVVRGQDKTIPRLQAITLLKESDVPQKREILRDLVKDENEDTRIRHQAIINLYSISNAKTTQFLLDNLPKVRDDRTQATIVQVLGRVGGATALREVDRVYNQSTGFTRNQAEFAAALIAYRHNLSGHELAFPNTNELLALPVNVPTQSTHVSLASDSEASLTLKYLAEEPFGIDLSRRSLHQIKCQPRDWMLALNEEFSGSESAEQLQKRKALVGLLALKSLELDSYSTAYMVLTTPQSNGQIQILLKTINGQTGFAGVADIERNEIRFSVQSIRKPGAVAVSFKAVYANGRLTNIEAQSATLKSVKQRVPRSG